MRNIILVLTFSTSLLGQTSSLTSPALKANAEIVQHNPPGSRLESSLSEAKAAAPSRGIPWKGLDIISSEEPNGDITDALLLGLLKKRACLADAIVIGDPTSSLSHLSAYGTAVYTDYLIAVNTVLKDNGRAPIRDSRIIVTRRGGSIVLPDGPLTYDSQEFPNLQPRKTYLQFLRYIPESSSYYAIDGYSTAVAGSDGWMLVRTAMKDRALLEFKRGAFEAIISEWLRSCGPINP